MTVFVCFLSAELQNCFCSVGLAVGDDSLAGQPMMWRKCSPLKYNFSAYLSRAEFCDLIKSWSSRWNYRLIAAGFNVTII